MVLIDSRLNKNTTMTRIESKRTTRESSGRYGNRYSTKHKVCQQADVGDAIVPGTLYACTTRNFGSGTPTSGTWPASHCYLKFVNNNGGTTRYDAVNSRATGTYLDHTASDVGDTCVVAKNGLSQREGALIYDTMHNVTGDSNYARFSRNCCSAALSALEALGANQAGQDLIRGANLGLGTTWNRADV